MIFVLNFWKAVRMIDWLLEYFLWIWSFGMSTRWSCSLHLNINRHNLLLDFTESLFHSFSFIKFFIPISINRCTKFIEGFVAPLIIYLLFQWFFFDFVAFGRRVIHESDTFRQLRQWLCISLRVEGMGLPIIATEHYNSNK